jgi:ferrous-iron efflux pump FieF
LNEVAAIASLGVATLLILAKLLAWLVTDSVAILTSLVDSGIDALASLVTLVGVRQAAQPADRAHRFGHGKAEPIAALAQAAFVAGSALILASEAIQRLIAPQVVSHAEVGIMVMALAIVLTVGLIAFQRHVIRRTGSIAITADRLHYRSDLLMNLAVIVALVLTQATGWPFFDPLFALAIVLLLVHGAHGVGWRALDMLMDRELSQSDRARIEGLAASHPQSRGVHDLRTRRAGSDVFIELHLELDGRLELARAHAVTDEIEGLIGQAFPEADILIHQEPAGLEDERLDARIDAGEP